MTESRKTPRTEARNFSSYEGIEAEHFARALEIETQELAEALEGTEQALSIHGWQDKVLANVRAALNRHRAKQS